MKSRPGFERQDDIHEPGTKVRHLTRRWHGVVKSYDAERNVFEVNFPASRKIGDDVVTPYLGMTTPLVRTLGRGRRMRTSTCVRLTPLRSDTQRWRRNLVARTQRAWFTPTSLASRRRRTLPDRILGRGIHSTKEVRDGG